MKTLPELPRVAVTAAVLCAAIALAVADEKGPASDSNTAPQAGSARFTAVPDSSEADDLLEQLRAEESAAAAQAEAIREIQSRDQGEHDRQQLAEHERKLKDLLTRAFDLKLELEALEVKELQSRLSRLERQLGQRKKLRDRIVSRRMTALVEGSALTWDASEGNAPRARGSSVDSGAGAKPAASPAAIALLRERATLVLKQLQAATIRPEEALRACKDLAEVDPAEADKYFQDLLKMTENYYTTGQIGKADLLAVQAAYELAKDRAEKPAKPKTAGPGDNVPRRPDASGSKNKPGQGPDGR